MDVRLDATVHGVVHGVGFRVYVLDTARRLGVAGWVANERVGVRVVAEGPRGTLEDLVSELGRGPVTSLVDRVVSAWLPATGEFEGFSIRSGWHGGD
jgi:acylphosphatase